MNECKHPNPNSWDKSGKKSYDDNILRWTNCEDCIKHGISNSRCGTCGECLVCD